MSREKIRSLLGRVSTPAQYLGGEVGQVVKGPDEADQRWALLFPDTYAIGMSHLGTRILYGILNGMPGVAAERAFAPWPDMEAELRQAGLPLLTLETHTPVRGFDVVGFSLQYELSFTNVLAMLDLAGIPLLARDRGRDDPLVIGGGVNAFHPEPLADFFDLFLLGDGEEAVPILSRGLRECREAGLSRRETVVELARATPGLYAPALYDVRYHPDGRIAEVAPNVEGIPERVLPTWVSSLEEAWFPTTTPVPNVRTTHDRISIEVMRGCTQGCRFCQAGMLKRPNRMRSVERILDIARKSYRATGYDEISLLSLSTADYPYLVPLMNALDREFRERRVGISVPSLRVNETLALIPSLVERVRKSTLTIAPETATDRLRTVIDKSIRNEDLYAGVREAWVGGWRAVKLYFMIGLPTETGGDIDEIAVMARRCSDLRREAGGGPGTVTLSVSNFVPKPHTPFQWEPMATRAALGEKAARLRAALRGRRNLKLRAHNADRSLMEGALARGDRRMGRVLLRLLEAGSRFDAWDEHFDRERWERAFAAEGIDPGRVNHRPRDLDEVLPWDHLGAPVSRTFLAAEREKAAIPKATPNCMEGRCHHCGIDPAACAPSRREVRRARAAGLRGAGDGEDGATPLPGGERPARRPERGGDAG